MAADEDPPKVPDTLPDELENAVVQGGNPEPGAPAEPEAPQLPPKERRAARRAAGAPATSGPKTAEEREAARQERRRRNATQRRAYRAREKRKRDERRPRSRPPRRPTRPSTAPGAQDRQGVVVSDKADKTVVVRIDVAKRHRRYGKIMRTSSKLHVHDERNDAGLGDTVRVIESRPLSATKRWRLVEVVERAR
jgi:small subunit ribosomal protein S17